MTTVAALPPTVPASAEPSSIALSINNLPDAAEEARKKKGAGVPGPMPVARDPDKQPDKAADKQPDKAADKGSDKPDKPIKKVSTDKVPIFTNPGF